MIENVSTDQVQAVEELKASSVEQPEDFLAGVEAADSESFNVCISCD